MVVVDRLPDPELISLDEAAAMLHVGRTTAYQLARRGEFLGAMRVGSRWRVSVPRFRRIMHGEEAMEDDVRTEPGALACPCAAPRTVP